MPFTGSGLPVHHDPPDLGERLAGDLVNDYGNEALRFLVFVATDGVGLVNPLYVALHPRLSSSSSFLRVISVGGFSLYSYGMQGCDLS